MMLPTYSKSRRRRWGVSNIIAAVMLVMLAIAAAGAGIIYMNKQAERTSQITQIDAGESRLRVNPTTGEGELTLVFTNTGTTPETLRWGKIGLHATACIYFPVEAKITYGTSTVIGTVTTSDMKASGITAQGLALASQASVTIKFTHLAGYSVLFPPNTQHLVTIYTTGAETFTFKLTAEPSGA
jgi:flagellin-like protein